MNSITLVIENELHSHCIKGESKENLIECAQRSQEFRAALLQAAAELIHEKNPRIAQVIRERSENQ